MYYGYGFGFNYLGGGTPPVNAVAPAITGTAQVGSVLTCSTGTWTGTAPITYAYQWKRGGVNIGGATSSTYTLVAADAGTSVKCTVTATNGLGSVNADSNTVSPTWETDAQAFITAASITDATQQSAVNQLVVDLKAANIWAKMKAVYPFVGGSASSHAVCLKRLTSGTFNGGFTHDSGGAKGNGINGWFNTGLAGNSGMGQDDYHATIYSRTNTTSLTCDLGLWSTGFGCSFYTQETGALRINSMGATQVNKAYPNSLGFFFQSRYTSGNLIYGRDTDQNSVSSTSVNLKTSNWIGWRTGDYNGEYSERYLGTITIGTGLNGTEITALRNAVVNYNTALSRNV